MDRQRAWHYAQSLYGRRWHSGHAWRLCRMMAESAWEADLAWEDVSLTLKSLVHHCHKMARHAWGVAVTSSIEHALRGCKPSPARFSLMPDTVDPTVERLVAAGWPDPDHHESDVSFDVRRRILFIQQTAFCELNFNQFISATN